MESFTTLAMQAKAEIVEKKSRFIAYVAPVSSEEEALAFLERARNEHRMARHTVYAYVLREGGRVRYSDDGEPAKTAGLPSLHVLQHAELVDVIVVVARYFGGILLGTGGLVRAYARATQAALDKADRSLISLCVDFELQLPYSLYDQLVYTCQQLGAKTSSPEFSDVVKLTVTVLVGKVDSVRGALQELFRDQVTMYESEPYNTRF